MPLSIKVPRSGAIAMLVTGMIYTALSVPHLLSTTVTVPVAKTYLARGSTIPVQDVGYSKISTTHFSPTPGNVLKTSIVPGQVLTMALVGGTPNQNSGGVLVTVVPSESADLSIAAPGSNVRVVLIRQHGRAWQSPVERVLSASGGGGVLGGGTSSIVIRLPLVLADQYLSLASRAEVFVVGAP